MKSLNYTQLICGIALLLSACSDTDSSTTSIDSTNVTEADSLAEATTESKQSTSISIPSASEQEAAEPVDVSKKSDRPHYPFRKRFHFRRK